MQNSRKSLYSVFEGDHTRMHSKHRALKPVSPCLFNDMETNKQPLSVSALDMDLLLTAMNWLLFYLKISHWTKWAFFIKTYCYVINNFVCYMCELKTSSHLNQVLDAEGYQQNAKATKPLDQNSHISTIERKNTPKPHWALKFYKCMCDTAECIICGSPFA